MLIYNYYLLDLSVIVRILHIRSRISFAFKGKSDEVYHVYIDDFQDQQFYRCLKLILRIGVFHVSEIRAQYISLALLQNDSCDQYVPYFEGGKSN